MKILRYDYYYDKFTNLGLNELKAKCPHIRIAKLHSCGRLYDDDDDEKYVSGNEYSD